MLVAKLYYNIYKRWMIGNYEVINMAKADRAFRVISTSGGGKIIFVGRRMYNKPRKTDSSQWLGGKKRRRSLGMAVIRLAPRFENPTDHQRAIGGVGKACGLELKGKLKGKDWATIKKAMAACVLIKHGREVPDDWKKVYESVVKGTA